MEKEQRLSTSLEDYLEAILHLEQEFRVARVKDIAERLGVQMPSVTAALKTLRDKGLINYERNSFISLTESGMVRAISVEKRHVILRSFLQDVLLLPPEDAEAQACRIEHAIDSETALRLQNCTRFIRDTIFPQQAMSPDRWKQILTEAVEEQ